jgi:hypothetical protein
MSSTNTAAAAAVVIDAPHHLDTASLIAAVTAAGVDGPVMTGRDHDALCWREAHALAAEIVEAPAPLIRQRLAEFERRFPGRSRLVREAAIDLDAEGQAAELAGDRDTQTRAERLIRAAGDYRIAGRPSTGDDRASRLAALRGRLRAPFDTAWRKLLDAAEEIDPAAAEQAARRVQQVAPADEPVLGAPILSEAWDVISVVVDPASDVLIGAVTAAVTDWWRRRRTERARQRPEPETVKLYASNGRVIKTIRLDP